MKFIFIGWALAVGVGLTMGESFSITPSTSNAGLYIEEISEIRLYHQEWKMITYINMSDYQEEYMFLKNFTKRIASGCSEFQAMISHLGYEGFLERNHHRWCSSMSGQVQYMMDTLEENNAKWWVNFEANPREKRGLINAIGMVSNALFGTLAQDDAEHYLSLFERIKQENSVRDELLGTQTSIIQSAVDFMKEEKNQREAEYKQIDVRFNLLAYHASQIADSINKDIRILAVRQEIQEVTSLIIMVMMRFANRQKKFLDAISVGQKSPNSPVLVAPATFVAELYKIRNAIAAEDMDLPLPISVENLALYYHISTPEVRILNNQMIISFSIPLVGTKLYALNKVTSMPYRIKDNLFGFILPTHDFLALDKLNEKYVYMSNEELQLCHHISENSLVCQLSNPVMNANSANLCEINMIKKTNFNKVCNTRIANFTEEVWIKLRKPNTWIYVLPNGVNIYIKCKNKVVNNLLEGTGIIAIEDGCSIKSDNVIISGYKITESHVIQGSVPSIELANFNTTIQTIFDLGNFTLPIVEEPKIIENGQSNKLRDMSVELRNVKRIQLEKLNKFSIRNSQNTVSVIAVMVYVIVFAVSGYVAYKMYCKYKQAVTLGLLQAAIPRTQPIANTPV